MRRGALVVVALAAHAMRAEAAPEAAPTAAPADAPVPGGGAAAKKDRALRAKTAAHGAPPAPGTKPAKLVNLYNTWTKEWLAIAVSAPGAPGKSATPAPATLDRFLRDHFTNKPTRMEPRLLAFVLEAADHFHSDVVQIVSGFRHPKYNLILRKKGHQVARDSQHTHGTAIDFYLPRVPARTLEAWARAQKHGGVGFYPDSGFVHMDTGPVRTWSGE